MVIIGVLFWNKIGSHHELRAQRAGGYLLSMGKALQISCSGAPRKGRGEDMYVVHFSSNRHSAEFDSLCDLLGVFSPLSPSSRRHREYLAAASFGSGGGKKLLRCFSH